jgi:hypothetical protein
MSAVNRSVIGSISVEETNRFPRCWQKNLWMPCPYCSRGCQNVSISRSMQRTSSVTCPDKTSAAVRGSVIMGSGWRLGRQRPPDRCKR